MTTPPAETDAPVLPPQPVDPPAVDDKLLAEDARTGKALALMLSGLFLYTIFAMSACVYLTWVWTH